MEVNPTNFTYSVSNSGLRHSDSSSTRFCASSDTGYISCESGNMNSAVAEYMLDWMDDEDDTRSSVIDSKIPCHASSQSNSCEETPNNDGDESLTSDDASETIDCMIDYLQEKQSLLQRAAAEFRREENYAAATARKYANIDVNKDGPDSIWTMAKELKQAYYITSSTESSSFSSSSSKPSSTSNLVEEHPEVISPKHPEIDLSTVIFSSSAMQTTKNYDEEPENDSQPDTTPCLILPSFLGTSWIAKAFMASLNLRDDDSPKSNWQRIFDPISGSLGLLPPSSIAANIADYMTLDEAVGLVYEPRFVVNSTPPFSVVFANRAFLELYNTGSTEAVVGKPIDSIIYEVNTRGRATIDPMNDVNSSQFFLQSNDRPCNIRVRPVVDKSKRQKISVAAANHDNTTGCSRTTSRITHILVSVSDLVVDDRIATNNETVQIAAVETKYDSTPPDSSAPFGTVG